MITDIINKEGFKIETERLFIVPVTEKYAKHYFENFTLEITKYQYPEPFDSIEAAECFIRSVVKTQREGTDLTCNILDKKHNFIGSIEIHRLQTTVPEVGLWICEDVQHKGYGQEAISKFLDFFREHMEVEFFIYEADCRNLDSIHLAEKLGGIKTDFNEVESNGGDILKLNVYVIK